MKHFIPEPFSHIQGIQKYGRELSELCKRVYKNQHPAAEKQFLSLTEKVFTESKTDVEGNNLMAVCDVLYSEFNDYFAAWITEQGLKKPPHAPVYEFSNYFLDTASQQRKLEDVIWELSVHIINSPRPDNRRAIRKKMQSLNLNKLQKDFRHCQPASHSDKQSRLNY